MKTRETFFPGAARVFHRMYTRLGCPGRPPNFVVALYPYANLTHTIRLRGETAFVRLSDLLRRAPLPVLEAIAAILLARLYRRRTPRAHLALYRRFSLARATRRRVLRLRRARGRRVHSIAAGQFFHLGPVFNRLNRRYFRGKLHQPRLGWSRRRWRAQLGSYDPGLDQIVINRRLDRAGVPPCVLEYVLFHEMLHVKHPLRRARCGLQAHSAAFRREEKRYVRYQEARRWLRLSP